MNLDFSFLEATSSIIWWLGSVTCFWIAFITGNAGWSWLDDSPALLSCPILKLTWKFYFLTHANVIKTYILMVLEIVSSAIQSRDGQCKLSGPESNMSGSGCSLKYSKICLVTSSPDQIKTTSNLQQWARQRLQELVSASCKTFWLDF